MKTIEVSSATETNQADFVKLEEKNRKVAEATCAEEDGSDQRTIEQIRRGYCTNQIYAGCLGLAFSRIYASIIQS